MLPWFGRAQDGQTLFHTEQNLGDEGYNLIFVLVFHFNNWIFKIQKVCIKKKA